MSEPELVITVKDGVRILRFNRPKRKNALNREVLAGLRSQLNEAAADPETVILVITGTGEYFTSGNDLSNFQKAAGEKPPIIEEDEDDHGQSGMMKALTEGVKGFKTFVSQLIDFPKPIVVVVNGPAVGMGVTMLGLCDFVFASDQATFHAPFVTIGQVPEACSSYTFPRLMGTGKAAEMLLFGRKINAVEAYERGLVSEVVPNASLHQVWDRIYGWAQLPRNTMFRIKSLLRANKKDLLHQVNEEECARLVESWTSDEFFEAMMKFFSRKSKL